jgi:hypothetical protein
MLISNQQIIDLGSIQHNRAHSFNFELKNAGDNPISINRVNVGCGSCTTASATNNNLNPGETTLLNVVFTPASIGPQTKNVTVIWDEKYNLRLNFTATSHE